VPLAHPRPSLHGRVPHRPGQIPTGPAASRPPRGPAGHSRCPLLPCRHPPARRLPARQPLLPCPLPARQLPHARPPVAPATPFPPYPALSTLGSARVGLHRAGTPSALPTSPGRLQCAPASCSHLLATDSHLRPAAASRSRPQPAVAGCSRPQLAERGCSQPAAGHGRPGEAAASCSRPVPSTASRGLPRTVLDDLR